MNVRADPRAFADRLAAFRADLGDVPVIDDPVTVRRKSRDYFWYSPVLNASLAGKPTGGGAAR